MTSSPHIKSSRLVRGKPGVLRPGFVGMRGQWSYDYGMQDYEYPPPPESAKSAIMLDGETLKYFDILQGVAQGCMLSPTLLKVFIDDLIRAEEAAKLECFY